MNGKHITIARKYFRFAQMMNNIHWELFNCVCHIFLLLSIVSSVWECLIQIRLNSPWNISVSRSSTILRCENITKHNFMIETPTKEEKKNVLELALNSIPSTWLLFLFVYFFVLTLYLFSVVVAPNEIDNKLQIHCIQFKLIVLSKKTNENRLNFSLSMSLCPYKEIWRSCRFLYFLFSLSLSCASLLFLLSKQHTK